MSGPIVRKYGVPNWDEIFGGKKSTPAPKESGVNKASKPAKKKAAAKKAPAKKAKKK